MSIRILFGLSLVLINLTPAMATEEESVYAVTEEWEDYTNSDTGGAYWDILRAVFENQGFQLRTETFPYARAAEMVNSGNADILVGAYHGEQEQLLYPDPSHAFDADKVIALYPEGSSWSGIESLAGKDVAWVRGYEYGKYLDVDIKANEVSTREQAIKMLKAGRVDYVLDAAADIDSLDPALLDGLERAPAMKLDLFPAFQNSERGRKLLTIYEQQLPLIIDSGQIKEIFDKHGLEWSGG